MQHSDSKRRKLKNVKNIKLLDLLCKEDLLKNIDIDCQLSGLSDINCICGESMKRMNPMQLPYSDCYCDVCNDTKPMKIIYHCPQNKIEKVHPNGYDICERCVGLQLQIGTFIDRKEDLDIIKNNGEMLELTFKWLNLKYLLRKFERNWEPKSKKIFTHLYAQCNDINNIYLSNDDIKWLNINKSILRKYIFKLEKKLNCITFYDRINSLNKSHYLMDINHMNSIKKNKWQSQQIKKKNTYKTYAHNIKKYKHSKKQIMYKTKTKPSLKKKKRYSLNDAITCYDETKGLVRLQNNIKMKQIGSCNVTDVVENSLIWYPPIHYPLNYLWSLKPDFLLGQQVELTYWNTKSVQLKGILVCLSNCGQFKLGHISYCSSKIYEKNHLNVTTDSYWFHLNCIKSIFLVNELNKKKYIRNLVIDMMKIRLINYFLFICSFKTNDDTLSVNNSPIKYLIKSDLNTKHKHELQEIKDEDIIRCPFAIQMSSQFIYGTKQNDFEYLEKINWKKYPVYFRHEQILTLLCSYKQSLIQYIKMNEIEERKMKKKKYEVNVDDDDQKEIKKVDKTMLGYMDWDTINIKKQMKAIKEENRTV